MSGCCWYVTCLWHCIWSWSRLRWVGQPTSASPLGSSPYLLQPSQHRGTVSATHESAQMRTQEDARFKNVFLSYMLHAATQLRSCVHPGVPPQSNGIRMELPGQVKYKLFQPLPPPFQRTLMVSVWSAIPSVFDIAPSQSPPNVE